jgi:hypothetical protein
MAARLPASRAGFVVAVVAILRPFPLVRRARPFPRSLGLSGEWALGFGTKTLSGTGWGRSGFEGQAAASKAWEPKHRDGRRGSSPEAAKRCVSWRRALRATTAPVKMNDGGEVLIWLLRSVLSGTGLGRPGFEGHGAGWKAWEPKHRDGGAGQAPKPRLAPSAPVNPVQSEA